MSFADIINAESKKLEQSQGGNDKVGYPTTKHKRLFFEKNQREILLQILPAANLVGAFAEPTRKIFLSTRTSTGKELNSNFTLDPEVNEGSLLEHKITEWASRGLIPNGFGGQQSPKRAFLVNAVKVIQHPQNPQQWVQERDQNGELVVRVFEVPQSGYQNLLRKIADPLYNVSGSEFSFMDPNRPSPIKISKPAKGQMEYPVEVYTSIILPPLGQGWENQLENLAAHAVPTERLENGQQWVQAFIDMKEGRKPNQKQEAAQDQPQANQYGANPFGAAPQPQANPYGAVPQPIPNANPYGAAPQPIPNANPYGAAPQPNPYAPQPTPAPTPQPNPYAAPAPQPNPYAAPTPNPYAPAPTPGIEQGIGEEVNIDSLMPTNMANGPVPTPAPQPTPAPVPTQNQAPIVPTHNLGTNDNGLLNIDAMLEKELNGGN
jgi:hypothetical protein